jgi:hypothetical protein
MSPTTIGRPIAFTEKYNNKFIVINQENGNLPSNDVRCVAEEIVSHRGGITPAVICFKSRKGQRNELISLRCCCMME